MKKILLSLTALFAVTIGANAQDSPLSISGYGDAYYKYDFAQPKDAAGVPLTNISTSFANEQNSMSIGMIGLALKKTTGKASFVGELSYGPRGQGQSILDAGANGQSFHIQNHRPHTGIHQCLWRRLAFEQRAKRADENKPNT